MRGIGRPDVRAACRRRIVPALALLALAVAACSGGPSEQFSLPPSVTKPYEQLASDLHLVTAAGYRRICIFDLRGIQDTANDAYFELLRSYADQGVEISVFVQEMSSSRAVALARRIGAATAVVNSSTLERAFRSAGFKTVWWSLVAFPGTARDQPTYLGWPDLRSDAVRSELAARAVRDARTSGLNLDYIRWNGTDEQRTAEQVTDLLRRIRSAWGGRGPLTADVYPYLGRGNGDGGAYDRGQAWDRWLAEGLVDEVYPMAYLSADLPWLIPQWSRFRGRVVPLISAVDTRG